MTNVIGGLSGQGHRIQLTRTGVATQPAFERHFEDLLTQYSIVQVVNLLSCSREGEIQLSQAYSDRHQAYTRETVGMTHFDLHQRSKLNGLEGVRHQLFNEQHVGGQVDQFGYCLAALQPDGKQPTICESQTGVFRTNCLDCCSGYVIEDSSREIPFDHLSTSAPIRLLCMSFALPTTIPRITESRFAGSGAAIEHCGQTMEMRYPKYMLELEL
ncbi:uncharacterized protein MELLADRAFT_66446 [Melampsora larici-populina 98AG31]|uniref:SAC domain-containing protein n=1 Tax=Melampsora larici-populina (strain 98AG31 / pathotype 3-4-7) TaxID=747676 RepID=F4RZ86_MELLP|nr:uncharacterized protein MELLADRAFT_66446 [Melampsora larici-populina 98AG31]EGG02297.1 hypothetical protein MELLADRAFT_66446 [Melampsora larici-populina 98AG31]